MEKVILVDQNVEVTEEKKGGHFENYMKALGEIENTEEYIKHDSFVDFSKNPILGSKQRDVYFKSFRGKVLHLLHFDSLYMFPECVKKIAEKNRIIATVHAFPRNGAKQFCFRRSAKYVDVIIVHSEYIKKQMHELGVNNVVVIDYPAFNAPKEKCLVGCFTRDYVTFLCIGSTRYEKGADIVADSFQFISDSVKKQVRFIFAGKESAIKYSYISEKAKESNIRIEIDNKVLSDEEYWQKIYDTDVLLVPYRKIMTANSGPMTDALVADKYILGPDEGNLGFLIKKYALGETFRIEDAESLGKTISCVANNKEKCTNQYRNRLTKENFIQKHKELYDVMCIG